MAANKNKELTISHEIESSVGVKLADLTNIFLLESIKGFGPQKFKELFRTKISIRSVLEDPNRLLKFGKRGEGYVAVIRSWLESDYSSCRERAAKQIMKAHSLNAYIVTYEHPSYPENVFESNLPTPVLYVRGSLEVLRCSKTVACVGSRKIRDPYSKIAENFTKIASRNGFTIVSGFALGADTIGHRSAFDSGGATICVMPGGLDRPFPPENKPFWLELLNSNKAAFVSEFGFGVGANALNLRKRNKSIVAFSRGVLVAQSSVSGGAMNAYRFACEQKKPVATIETDGDEATSGNKLILDDPKFPATVFSIAGEDESQYMRWLEKLSYLT